MAKNIAVIGDSESIKGFAAVGLDIYPCEASDNASQLFRKLADSERYAIIYITEELFTLIDKERERFKEKMCPAVIPILGVKGNSGIGKKRLSKFVEQAVGSDIIFNN